MNKLTVKPGLVFAALILSTNVSIGQQATEVYIPIGNSPGVSQTSSLLGKITGLDYASRSIELMDRDGPKTINVNDETLYYLDRSKYKRKNDLGTMQDCKLGRLIEVSVADGGDVKWIKIEVD